MSGERDVLAAILDRKRAELQRRRRHRARWLASTEPASPRPGPAALEALRRPTGGPVRVIAEIKFRSPSAGTIRPRGPGDAIAIAHRYAQGGASAISVLADGPGFGGSALDVRRVAQAIDRPVLFKEFVLDELQVRLARILGAALVLLLVRALDDATLNDLVAAVRTEGLEPVVEAADEAELERALRTDATIIGVNARDLRTFRVDRDAAARCVDRIPPDRVAVLMSGISEAAHLRRARDGRADAVLIGEGLMRAPDPGERLHQLLGSGS